MTMLVASVGALTEIVRLREAAGTRDDTGRWIAGATTETTLLASVQPVLLGDVDMEGGVQLVERLKVFAPAVEYVAVHGDRLGWGTDLLAWGADVLRWAAAGGLTEAAGPVLAAAFDGSGADRVRLADGRLFVVETSMAWPGHVEATLLRET